MPHTTEWDTVWTKPDLTPAPGKTLVTTEWGWSVQYPENLLLGALVDIGYGTYINAVAGVTIGDEVEIGGGCHIYSHDSIGDIQAEVYIGSGCMIGAHSVILPGVTIGDDAIIGAMSLVKHDVGEGCTCAGVPARPIRKKGTPKSIQVPLGVHKK